MSLMLAGQGTGRSERELAEVAVHAMAAVLAANGVESRCACPEDFGCLQITSVPGVTSFISVDEDGDATWEYRLHNGAAPGPERIIGMTMKMLGAGEPDYDDPPIERDSLTSAIHGDLIESAE